jgi:hypothetical protein
MKSTLKRVVPFYVSTNMMDEDGTYSAWFSASNQVAPIYSMVGGPDSNIFTLVKLPTNYFDYTPYRGISGGGGYTNDQEVVGHPHGDTNAYTANGGTNFPEGRSVWYTTDYGIEGITSIVSRLVYFSSGGSFAWPGDNITNHCHSGRSRNVYSFYDVWNEACLAANGDMQTRNIFYSLDGTPGNSYLNPSQNRPSRAFNGTWGQSALYDFDFPTNYWAYMGAMEVVAKTSFATNLGKTVQFYVSGKKIGTVVSQVKINEDTYNDCGTGIMENRFTFIGETNSTMLSVTSSLVGSTSTNGFVWPSVPLQYDGSYYQNTWGFRVNTALAVSKWDGTNGFKYK